MDIRNPSLNLGVKIIDRDHAEISEMMLDLRLGLAQGKPSSLTSAFLQIWRAQPPPTLPLKRP